MSKGKHLTLDDRKSIQMGLQEGRNFQEIAREIGKNPSTVSKEIRKHRIVRRTASFNPCSKSKDCYMTEIFVLRVVGITMDIAVDARLRNAMKFVRISRNRFAVM